MTNAFHLGFHSQERELQNVLLPIEGAIPDWLSGVLIRNCPSKFDFPGERSVKHWFDGLSMLHNFVFRDGKVLYSCRFLRSQAFTNAQLHGRLCSREFGTDPSMNLWDRTAAIFQQHFTDNANVNVAKIAGVHVALTETPTSTAFDPENLNTVGKFKFDDRLVGQTTTAHPHFDYSSNCLFNILTHISAASTCQIYRLEHGSRQRVLLASLPVKEPAYIHSFALTERYLVLSEFPLRLNPL